MSEFLPGKRHNVWSEMSEFLPLRKKLKRVGTGEEEAASASRAREDTEEVGHCMLPYIRDQILELV